MNSIIPIVSIFGGIILSPVKLFLIQAQLYLIAYTSAIFSAILNPALFIYSFFRLSKWKEAAMPTVEEDDNRHLPYQQTPEIEI